MIDQPSVGIGDLPFASKGDLGLDKMRVTQCALSRICGVCAQTLDRPVVFLGSAQEAEANAFHFPPTHRVCAEHALRHWARTWGVALGQAKQPDRWVLVTTAGFEFVRPTAEATGVRAQLGHQQRRGRGGRWRQRDRDAPGAADRRVRTA